MATTNFFIVTGNTAPAYQITCERDGSGIDLSGATAELILQEKSTATVTNSGHQSCTVVTAASGIISYTAESTDFPDKGTYVADIKITYGDGGIEILYNQAKFKVRQKIT